MSNALRNRGNGLREGVKVTHGVSRVSVGKVRVKSKKSSNSLPVPVKKKNCFNFELPSSGFTDFNISILPVPVLKDLKATDLSAACRVRSETELLGHLCSEASLAHRSVRSRDLLYIRDGFSSGCAAETPFLVRELHRQLTWTPGSMATTSGSALTPCTGHTGRSCCQTTVSATRRGKGTDGSTVILGIWVRFFSGC